LASDVLSNLRAIQVQHIFGGGRSMTGEFVASDCWLVSQLLGIRMLERELAHAFKKPHARKEHLRRRVKQLHSWVEAVDRALVARAHCSRRNLPTARYG